VGNDITERKRSEDAQRLLATAVEQASEGIAITDTSGYIRYANPSFERISGYSEDEIIGSKLTALEHEARKTPSQGELWDSIAGTNVWTGRLTGKRKDGTIYQADTTVAPVRDVSGQITKYVAVQRDVTKEVELHEQLLQAQKMEAVGVLAGGIAHDFNNLLTVVMGHSELLAARENIDDHVLRDLQKIHQASVHGADLVNRLLTFSRKGEVRPRLVNLNEQIEQLNSLLSRVIPRMIEIELRLAPELHFVNADPGQMEQVLMNLAVNAEDAMPDGGRLVIETANVGPDGECSKDQAEAEPGRFVMLSVSDTGHGMDQETQEHIFEPFYTTKEIGRGTGLGLAIAYGIVQQHSGRIECESFPGVGTTFKIYLPAAEAKPEKEPPLDQNLPLSGTETLLLVDDEKDVRDLGKAILGGAGYKIVEATNGEEALRIYRKQRRKISLVILDLIMPGMSGRECFQELVRSEPGIKVLISSGYPSSELAGDPAQIEAAGFVRKPYSTIELLRAVRSTLDRA
jgi:two-component system cell cycle sensor histidine kinase/response regulator CckA